jgi:hypothetical protein
VPLPVCIFGIILAIAQLVWQNLRSAEELRVNFLDVFGRGSSSAATQPSAEVALEAEAPRKPELSAFAIVALLLGLVVVIGPLPAVFLFTAGYLALTRHCSLARAIVYAAICAVVLYGLFGYVLGVQLNRGLLSGFISPIVDF